MIRVRSERGPAPRRASVDLDRSLERVYLDGKGSILRITDPRALDSAEKQENDDDDQNQPHSTRRDVTPLPAMRPSRQCAEECQYQHHDQYSSKHCSLFFLSSAGVCNAAVLPALPGRLDAYPSLSPRNLHWKAG